MSNSMDAEAIREIERLVNDGRSIRIVKAPDEPDGVYYLQAADGKHERVVAARKPYRTTLDTPDAFVKFVKENFRGAYQAIFYSFNQIVFQMEENYMDDCAECPLTVSPQFDWLQTKSAPPMRQDAFVRLLRITLEGCVTDSNLLSRVRNLKWRSGSDSEGSIQHGKSSMSRAIQAEVMGTDTIPEEIALSVPVWANWQHRAVVRCAIEIDAASQMFSLTPYPLSIQNAKDEALDSLAELFSEDGMPPAYLGKP